MIPFGPARRLPVALVLLLRFSQSRRARSRRTPHARRSVRPGEASELRQRPRHLHRLAERRWNT